jgi:hypothetical protein
MRRIAPSALHGARALALALVSAASLVAGTLGCNTGPKDAEVRPEPKPAPTAPAASASGSPAPSEGALRLGSPIEATAERIALADVAKNPGAFVGKRFATTGTVTAVCQHMGCWMEIKDEASEAHIKMAGHAFFVPKTASGRKARVLATLLKSEEEPACADEGMHAGGGGGGAAGAVGAKKGCRAEAEAQLGRPLAKLSLVAEGVELM